MQDPVTYILAAAAVALAYVLHRLRAREDDNVIIAEYEVEHPVDAFDMPERDTARWRRSYGGH